jgi:hypothetical protein
MLAQWPNPAGRRSTATGRSSTGTRGSDASSSGCSAHRKATSCYRATTRSSRAFKVSTRPGAIAKSWRRFSPNSRPRPGWRSRPASATRLAGPCRDGRCSPRCRARWPRRAIEAGGWWRCPTRTVTCSRLRCRRSACRSTARSWLRRSGRTSPPGHWRAFQESTGADPARHVHVAQSHFHDIVPADALGIRTVWINRLGERRQPAPTRELPDLSGLADVIDELVPG